MHAGGHAYCRACVDVSFRSPTHGYAHHATINNQSVTYTPTHPHRSWATSCRRRSRGRRAGCLRGCAPSCCAGRTSPRTPRPPRSVNVNVVGHSVGATNTAHVPTTHPPPSLPPTVYPRRAQAAPQQAPGPLQRRRRRGRLGARHGPGAVGGDAAGRGGPLCRARCVLRCALRRGGGWGFDSSPKVVFESQTRG